MESIDNDIMKFKREREINDYIEKNIFPPSLSFSHDQYKLLHVVKKNIIDINNFTDTNEILHINTCKMKNDIHNSISKAIELENNIKMIMENENIENENMENKCPICIEEFDSTNYLIPACGHKVCIPCFVKNITYNNDIQNGNKCCLCREKILPSV